jgi:hypothetical protein
MIQTAQSKASDASDRTKYQSLSEARLPDKICGSIADRVAIDAKGNVYLCCACPITEELRIEDGAMLTVNIASESRLWRADHPVHESRFAFAERRHPT